MVCCISFGAVSKKILIPLLGGILNVFINVIAQKSEIIKHPIIQSICSSLGMILSLIPHLITIKRTKTEKQKKIEALESSQSKNINPLKINYEYNDLYMEITYDKYKYIFFAAFMDFFETLLMLFANQSISLNLWIIEIILICSLSFYAFGTKLYSHQKLCLIILVILGVLLDLYTNDFFRNIDVDFLSLILRIISAILFSISMVLQKFIIEKKFVSPYEICFIMGITSLIFYSICIIISSNISIKTKKIKNLIEYKEKYYFDHFLSYIEEMDFNKNPYEIIIFIIFALIEFFFNLSILLTIKYFSPAHTIIILVIAKAAPSIINLISLNDINKDDIITLITLLVIFFVLLIFNEVIELNCFKLQDNTVKNIKERASNEFLINKSDGEDVLSSSIDSINKSNDLGINDKDLDLNINENEENEEKNIENN